MSSIGIDENNTNLNLDINKPKKRGRKPKNKLLSVQESIENKKPKKRGRKPKKKNEDEVVKIPKKRGRKPNIMYNNIVNNKNVFDNVSIKDNVLHLKINSEDIQDYIIMDNIYSYNPEISVPKPYDPENFDSTQLEITNNNGIIEDKPQDSQFNINNDSNNIFQNNEQIKNINNNDISIIENENKILEKIDDNIKEINIDSNKTCKKKKIRSILKYYNEYNIKKEWPLTSNIKCFWCVHNFDNIPCALPVKINNNIFYVFGNFCSKECAGAYNFDSNDTDNVIWERYSLLNYLYSIIEENSNLKIKLAPPRLSLSIFGGYLSINEFRDSFELNKNYKLIFPPMIPIIPSIEENNKDVLKKKESFYVPIDKDRIKQVNNDLRLRRKKPISNKNTLENCMRLKYN